ncbi:hypothetical protein D9O50_01250 [Oxalobacteraceae bacterium CAVE-383]|nr:hypothetical protein D9O50_01250 [Oxalobacteraceae bacterium CAVE-383]
MTDLPKLDFPQLAALARQSAGIDAACACSGVSLAGWESVPLSLDEASLEEVGTLFEDHFVEPPFEEYHPAGTRYDSPDAPIAPRYFPYNRCTVARCKVCGRHFLRYTEAGGYFVDRRIRLLDAALLVDAAL